MSGRVAVIGLSAQPLDSAALEALARARLVLGAPRHLETVAHLLPPVARSAPLTADLDAALGAVAAEPGPVAVLASGDPGFFGIVRALAARFGPAALQVLPAVSSVAQAFARVGLPWDDALVVSAHGRDPAYAVNACRAHPKVAVLTMPDFGPAELARALPPGRRLVVAERLGDTDERVTDATAEDVAAARWQDPNVVLSVDPAAAVADKGRSWPPRRTPTRWGLGEDAFEHRDGMITKAEVRAVALARLGPGTGDLVWDVGAGSGSVGVEAARLGAAVVAVDADPDQCARVQVNAARHQVHVDTVCATAPQALESLADPDAVFVGGGGHLVTAIVRVAADRARRAVVVALATIERVGPVRRAMSDAGLVAEATLVQAARVAPLGAGHRLEAGNPVFLVDGQVRR
ncbi:MAG TPA: precorrin-6y C5,15-methyltransferase (decarboxylating) subunit CbiE [Egibacteraceae bacterium]|nr:precorrin-6y C5,15-methyltransferase (decarboxylating) subunit CbiE [Egibacteraceae bacterium]